MRESNPEELRKAVGELYSLLTGITGIKDDSIIEDNTTIETFLSHGKAISVKDAARCVLDYRRTTQFLRGIYAAILESQKRFPNQTINVLYAGCGPFAALVLPLCTQFEKGELSLTLLDIHERSLTSVLKVFEEFGLSDFVLDYIQCDAAEYRSDVQPHIVITETMQKALSAEPQVAITMNLAPQLRDGGFFIPQKIGIYACLCKVNDEFSFINMNDNEVIKRNRIPLATLFEISAESVDELKQSLQTDSAGMFFFPFNTIKIPEKVNDGHDVMILTKIRIFDEFILDDYDSGLTCPTILPDLGEAKSNTQVEFHYSLSNPVGFKYRIV